MFDQQEANQSYQQLRRQYRSDHHRDLQRREGLPLAVGDRYETGYGLAIGRRRGVGAGLLVAEGFKRAGMDDSFDLHVRDPFDLAREIVDLGRDAARFAFSECVRHEGVERGVEMDSATLEDEDKLLEWSAAINERLK
jgi:hypothetical protein